MRRRLISAGIVAAALTALTATPALASWTDTHTDGETTLPLTNFASMVVDPVHSHVFVTGGPGDSAIVVMDFEGNIVATITNEPGATGMAISPDGATLYVALNGDDSIDRIDTGTLTSVGRLTLASVALTPMRLAYAAGYLWVDMGTCDNSYIARVNPETGGIKTFPGLSQPLCPAFTVDPSNTYVLYAFGRGSELSIVHKYDLTTNPPTLVYAKRLDGGDAVNLQDLVVTPDGASAFAANGSPYEFEEYSTAAMENVGVTYPVEPFPAAVALNPTGHFLAGGSTSVVNVYPVGSSIPMNSYNLYGLSERALAFAPDSSVLFAVTGNVFHVLHNPDQIPTTLALSSSSSLIGYQRSVTITAHLSAHGTNDVVSIYRTPAGGSRALLASGSVDSSGNFSATVELRRNSTFDAAYAGDDQYAPSTSTNLLVHVKAGFTSSMVGGYSSSGGYRLYHYTSNCPDHHTGCPAFAATVSPTDHAGDCVYFTVQFHNGSGWHTTLSSRCVHLDSSSRTRITLVYSDGSVKGVPFRVQAQFRGDSENAASATNWHYFKVTS